MRFATAANADVKIGRREMDFVLAGLQQNVGKDRKSGAGADYILDLLQAFEQFFFRNAKFHDEQKRLRCNALVFIRQPQSLTAAWSLRWLGS
jgi:hypothetical protein